MQPAERRTVTFLFTDIEGSTRLWEAQPVAMRAALERHNALLAQAIADAGGHVFKTVGDAFCADFARAADAVRAAYAAQSALAAAPWPEGAPIRVRMAVHTGDVEETGDDFIGTPLNRVARLMAAGHGGQTLLSRVTYELSRDEFPASTFARDLGFHKLKDLAHAEHVYELAYPGLAEFPPILSLSTHPNNLPEQLTTFVGREREVFDVAAFLSRARLVTVIGAGGSGKTRLALQVGAGMLEQFPGGVWLVELASIADGALVDDAVARTLGVKEAPGVSIADAIAQQVAGTRLLVVLDNCEHVLASCAALAEQLLAQCPGLRILATSREALAVAGEQTYRIPALALPALDAKLDAETLWKSEAVQLFVDRTRLVRPEFRIDERNAAVIASLCRRLDGIPLAIELAAARMRSLTVHEIDARLTRRFELLTSRSRTVLPRHQTLRALVDWSYDLLTDAERAMLNRCSVFAGGWGLDAAEAVCAGEGVEDVLDLLTSLTDKSLVQAEHAGDATRYRLLEIVREYARERLEEAGETAASRARHCAFYVDYAARSVPAMMGPAQASILERLESEHDNLRLALEWSASAGSLDSGYQLCGALGRFWMIRGHLSEGRAWCARFIRQEGPATREHADAINTDGTLAYAQGDYPGARAAFEACLAIRRQLAEPRGIAAALSNLGAVANVSGDQARARTLYEESLSIARQAQDTPGIARALANLASVLSYLGDHKAAQPLYEESLAMQRVLGDHGYVAITLDNLAEVAYLSGEYAKSCKLYRESLALRRDLGDRYGIADSLEGLATALASQGGGLVVPRIMAAARKLREDIGSPPTPYKRETYDRRIAAAREAIRDDAAWERAWQEGRALTLDQAIELSLAANRS
jgi:predicted ATPase/class 3 adenylate cyclase